MKKSQNPRKTVTLGKNPKGKLPYKKPKLTKYGTIKQLTLGAVTGFTLESGSTVLRIPRP